MSPPTSPQRAWNAGREAERNQRVLGSPPSRRYPSPTVQMSPQMSAALMVCWYTKFIDIKLIKLYCVV